MGDKIKQHRILAVQRFKNGESPESICTSLGKSKVWLYKWTKRYSGEETSWCEDRSRRPLPEGGETPHPGLHQGITVERPPGLLRQAQSLVVLIATKLIKEHAAKDKKGSG